MSLKTKRPAIKQPGENTFPFRLGDRVKDKINGLTGTATNRLYHVTGCDRFMIEIDSDDKTKKPELYTADANRFELVEARPDLHTEEVPDLHVRLGDKVVDLLHGLTGRVTLINVPLHGSAQVSVDPQWDAKEKKMPEGYFVDAPFVEVKETWDNRPKAETRPTEEQKKKEKPGACRMPSERVRGGFRI
ncbi:hypothetical protein [Erythrobacter phage vB_EliS-L02]|nr:hypothetical protein [Erythrobacter phage vB_EliS-L02]